jgi:hypothetical protein
LGLRHVEAKGLGYDKGYTTLEGMFFPLKNVCPAYPFIDLRGHIFNNNEYAANVGLGVRFEP